MTGELSNLYFTSPNAAKNGSLPLSRVFPLDSVYYFAYAREALVAGLRQAGIGIGAKILLPDFICRDILSVVHAIRASACFYSMNENLRPNCPPEQWPRADCVIAVNFFGFPQPLEPFQRYSQLTGAVVIEDNAHGFLSRDASGNWLGTRCKFGIFSIRKTLPVPNGAGLFVQDRNYVPDNRPFEKPPLISSAKSSLKDIARMAASRSPWLARRLVSTLNSACPGVDGDWLTDSPDSERLIPAHSRVNPDLPELIGSLDFDREITRRRTLYRLLNDKVKEHSGIRSVFGPLDAFTSPYMFVFSSESRQSLLTFTHDLLAEGLRFIRWPDLPVSTRNHCPDFYKNIWAVPFMW